VLIAQHNRGPKITEYILAATGKGTIGTGDADSGGSRPRIRDDVAHHSDLISLGVPR
jgi:hypothetical protein